MRIPFRQGIVQAPAQNTSAATDFLEKNGNKVTLNIAPPNTVVVAFAQGSSNYLVTENRRVQHAWAGPFTAGNDYWLYWDLDTTTGIRTFGHTTKPPFVGPSTPSPITHDHWFDTTNNIMRWWNGASWAPKIRVFAAKYQGGAVFVPATNPPTLTNNFIGTQIGSIGLNNVNAGSVVYDTFGKGLKKSNKEFLTTEDYITSNAGSPAQIKVASVLITARAEEPIPAYRVVRFVDYNVVTLANNFIADAGSYGVAEKATDADEQVAITMEGLITNLAWDWSAHPVNTELYVSPTGELTPTKQPISVPIATIVDRQTVLLRPSSMFAGGRTRVADDDELGQVLVSTPPTNVNANIIGVTTGPQGTFTLVGNWASDLNAAREMAVTGNLGAGADGTYQIRYAENVGPNTIVYSVTNVPNTTTASGIATFEKLPRVITEDDPRLGGGGGFTDRILESDTSVSVDDPGIGSVTTTIDGIPRILTTSGSTTFAHNVIIHGVRYPIADGTSGQAIVTDGAGNLSFSTVAGGGPPINDGMDIPLGTPTDTILVDGAVQLLTTTKVTDAIDRINEVLGLLVPPAPPTFPGSQTLTIVGLSSYRMASFAQTDNTTTGSKHVAGGVIVNNVRRSSTYTTSIINDVGPGDTGSVTIFKNAVASGSRIMTTGVDNGTYGDLIISDNVDYGTKTATPLGFWQSFDAIASGGVSPGWNEVYITHSAGGSTNTPFWYYDAATPGTPQFSSITFTPPGSPTLNWSSTVPHYTNINNFSVSFNVNRLSGDTYPLSDTFVTGTAGGSFGAPLSRTYTAAGVTVPLARNLYVSSGSHNVSTTTPIIGGHGSSSGGPSVSVDNGYAIGTQSLSPTAIVLHMTGSSITVVDEDFIPVNVGVGSGNGLRIVNPGSTDTPTVFSTSSFSGTSGPLQTHDTTVVGGIMRHDQTNYAVGHLPVGPNLSVGRTGDQYFTFKFTRTVVSKFDILFTGTMAGLWVALPGSAIDTTSTLSGWLTLSQSYIGAGIPGAGVGGNGSNGCALGGTVPLNTPQTNRRITATFGPVSSSDTPTKEILVRIKLTAGQSITRVGIEGASN